MEKELVEEIKRHFGVVAEHLESQVKLVAEGVASLSERTDRQITELRNDIDSKFSVLSKAFINLNEKIEHVETNVTNEVKETRDELKTMMKFSYTELDRRITMLEDKYNFIDDRLRKLESTVH